MSKHFIQLLKLPCLLSVFVSCFSSFRIYVQGIPLQSILLHDQMISKLNMHWLKDPLLPSLVLMSLPAACLGGSKPNFRDDVQGIQSTQGASYTCTVLPIISETVPTCKAIGNNPTHRACCATLYGMTCSESWNTAHFCPWFSFEVLHSCCTASLVRHSCCWRVDEVTVTERS